MSSSRQNQLLNDSDSGFGDEQQQQQQQQHQQPMNTNHSSPQRNNDSNPVPVHETTELIPELASAPPSGNSTAAVIVSGGRDPLSSSSFFLPPPPPPPSSSSSRSGGSIGVAPISGNAMPSSSRSFLPPPPRVTRPPASASSSTRTTTGLSPTSATTLSPPPSSSSGVTVITAGIPYVPPPPPPPPLPPPPPPPAQSSQQTPIIDTSPTYTTTYTTSNVAAPSPPPFLPVTTFIPPISSSKEQSILARRQTHVPVLIIATEEANKLAWKNGMQLSDLFQGVIEEIKPSLPNMTPFRSVNRSLFLKDVRVRFVTSTQLDPLSCSDAQEMLDNNAALRDEDGDVDQDLTLLEDRVDELLQEREKNREENLEDVANDAFRLTSPLDSMPWLIRYRHALDRSTDGLPHDLICCPPLVLLVCTATKEIERPETILQELYESNHVLPDAYKKGIYDPSTMRQEVLVLHDNNDDGHDNNSLDEVGLRQLLRSRFGSNAAVLRINSVSYETSAALAIQETSDLWGGKGKLGTFLSDNDRILLRRYFRSLLTTSLLPSMERRIADLNLIVNERKKGMRNLVKSFWRKPKDDTTTGSSPGGATNNVYNNSSIGSKSGGGASGDVGEDAIKYRYDSIESQTLLLADTLFLLEDYENALSNYRLIRDDYKSDKALVQHGNVLEMMGLCMYQLDPYMRAREIFNLFETALLNYTRAAEEERIRFEALARSSGELFTARQRSTPHVTRLAARLSLVLATVADTLARNRNLECADLLASVSSYESSLGGAVLMEQSSVFYFKAGMFRKYAFHMLMSGHLFQKAGQDHHAFRCFASALYIYRNGMWDKLYNHLKSALAAQLYTMRRMSVALILYAKLVGTTGGGKVSIQSQQKFVQHLIEICVDHTKAALAGADRIVPRSIPRNRRDIYRNERLERVVNIIRYTIGASRVLELPYVDLPNIADSSVRIWTKSDSTGDEKGESSMGVEEHFGKLANGETKIWEELELMTVAEINNAALLVSNSNNDSSNQLQETITAALAKIADPRHRRLISEIDKEKQNRTLAERSKRSSTKKSLPVVRAKGEPMFCDFQMKNPLGIEVQITEIQVVAQMVDSRKRKCTNEFAIELKDEAIADFQKSEWTFTSSDHLQFQVPNFCRISEPNVKSCTSAQSDPFFVVTNQSIELPPGGEMVISAGITPLVQGDLEILGVRCKLQDKVWLYHAFDIPGPLLKDTRANIMNRARGESMYLKAKVETDMPCLTAELIKRFPTESPTVTMDDGPLLEGQISMWTIRLRNVGTAPASAVTLKTNLPWIDIVGNDDSSLTIEEKESKATSRCIGPSGTLMTLPIEGMQTQTSASSVVEPGESIDIPIRVRTSGDKKQDFYMLYRYELPGLTGDSKRRSRCLRKMYEVPVYPSLSFSAKPLATAWKGKDILMSVELTNNRLDRPTDLYITLDRLSLTSRSYRLQALPDQFTKNEEFGDVLQIGWQERVTVHYRVISLKNENEDENCILSECPFSESGVYSTKACAASGKTDHLCLEDASKSFTVSITKYENSPWEI